MSRFVCCPLLVALLLWIVTTGIAQRPVTITGEAPFAKNEEIRLLVFDDLLNYVPTVAATDQIDKNGHFKLTCSTNQIKLVQLAIRTSKAEFFIVPDHTYQFQISVDTTLFKLVNPEKYGGYLQITNALADTSDLNYKINRFSNFFSRAMNHYAFRITVDKDRNAYDTLTTLLNDRFGIQYNPLNFYQSYIYYTCGQLDRVCFSKEQMTFYRKFYDNDYILYNNPAYMSLFRESYSGYLYNSRHISKELLGRTINEEPDYLTLFNEAGRDPMLTNERLRELVIILNLIEFHGNEEFDAGNIVKLLKYIKVSTHFPEHIVFIDNALARISRADAPSQSLVFRNEKGKKSPIKQFEGKDIYVQVFQSDCLDCIREMMLIKEFNKRYGEKIQFVSLNIDPDREDYNRFCKAYGEMFEWPILYFDGNYDWLLENGVETLPDYLIINAQGQLLQRYPPAPEFGLSDYLMLRFDKEEEQPQNPLFRN